MNIDKATPEVITALAIHGQCWSQIKGASSYFISNDGAILSCVKKPKLLRHIRFGKYFGILLRHDDGVARKHYIHRLVLESWKRDAMPGEQCRHLDGDKDNNNLANLDWGTCKENHADKKRHGTTAVGTRNPMAVLNEEIVRSMRHIRQNEQLTYKDIAKRFGVSTMTAYRAIEKQHWRNV